MYNITMVILLIITSFFHSMFCMCRSDSLFHLPFICSLRIPFQMESLQAHREVLPGGLTLIILPAANSRWTPSFLWQRKLQTSNKLHLSLKLLTKFQTKPFHRGLKYIQKIYQTSENPLILFPWNQNLKLRFTRKRLQRPSTKSSLCQSSGDASLREEKSPTVSTKVPNQLKLMRITRN